jgi:D-sedoheptulose 7-phosphate isomerase
MRPSNSGGASAAASGVLSGVLEAVAGIDTAELERAVAALADLRRRRARVYIIGNGGSASTGAHLACDLAKTAGGHARARLRATALSDAVSLLTAWGNDVSFDRVFANQLEVLVEEGDGVVVISVSGSSPNVLAALRTARSLGAVTIGLLGADGGAALDLLDIALRVPSRDYGVVESAHLAIVHAVTAALRDRAGDWTASDGSDHSPPSAVPA